MHGRGVRIFHISDLRMRSVDGPQAKRARLEAASRWRILGAKWTDNLAEIRNDGTPIDLVVFTGNLGDWGHPTDYPRAVAFLKQTCEALNVPLDRLFVVPGNHDISRAIQSATWRSLRHDVTRDPRAFSMWMAGEDRGALHGDDRRDQIMERQQAFWAAMATELGRPELAPKHSPHGRLGYRQAVTLPGLRQPIRVIGLDTAWLAGDNNDSGQLRLTEHQVSLLATTEGGEPLSGFRLALMHHRIADLADGADVRRLMADHVDLLLHSHQSEPAADVFQGPGHQLLVLATGCLYEGDEDHHHQSMCQVIDLALDEYARPQSADVRFRSWSEQDMSWGDGTLLYENAQGGRLRLLRGARGWHFAEAWKKDSSLLLTALGEAPLWLQRDGSQPDLVPSQLSTTPPPWSTTAVNAPTRIAPRVGGSERFEVGGLLGEGIYAQVYRATDTKLNRLVALKFIRPDVAGNNALEHARALARVQHPNIVTVYEVLDVANPVTGAVIPTVVMELIDGISLTERIGCSIERDELRRIGDALLDAIAAYHASNLAHLDLHDHNVIVGHPLVKVLDAIYFDTAALSSTATRSAQQAKDVRSVRDIIEQMLYSGGVSTEVAVTFLHATARRDLNLTLLRAAFDAAIP